MHQGSCLACPYQLLFLVLISACALRTAHDACAVFQGLKRERREAASTAKEQKRQKASAEAAGADAAE